MLIVLERLPMRQCQHNRRGPQFCFRMHPAIIERFPRLGELWNHSKTAADANYFGIYDTPILLPDTEKQFIEWEALLQALDTESFAFFSTRLWAR